MHIRPACERDADAIWDIFRVVIAGRDTYGFTPDTSREEGVGYWFGPEITSFVAEVDGKVLGMYKLIPNRRGLGRHVANASYMVHPDATGQGIGRMLGLHSLREARALGYDAMQFNFVVSTNRRAVALWQGLGFRIVGTQPRAFRHGSLGLVDAYVMHRFLDDVLLTFGTPPAKGAAVVRPSAYAVIANEDGEIALVEAAEGTLLPGGGVDAHETLETAIVREVQEECGLRVQITSRLGEAVQYVSSAKSATHFEKRSTFVTARVVSDAENAPEHVTIWCPPLEALAAATYESHAWAITRWTRLNT